MKTRCPSCQTIFRVTSEQLQARAGKVRCGTCRTVFNAINGLLDDTGLTVAPVSPPPTLAAAAPLPATAAGITRPSRQQAPEAAVAAHPDPGISPAQPAATMSETALAYSKPDLAESDLPADLKSLILPRESRELPGRSRWLEGVVSKPTSPAERSMTRPFAIAAVLLVLALAGQVVFHFRSTIATWVPALRPAFAAFSEAVGSRLPLPRHAELVSIETSDLQTDPERPKLLALQATLRNRASYAQAYPALELSLTDTADRAIARRIFLPEEYLPPAAIDEESFPANTDVELRLWLEAREIHAAGYRLYVFYP